MEPRRLARVNLNALELVNGREGFCPGAPVRVKNVRPSLILFEHRRLVGVVLNCKPQREEDLEDTCRPELESSRRRDIITV